MRINVAGCLYLPLPVLLLGHFVFKVMIDPLLPCSTGWRPLNTHQLSYHPLLAMPRAVLIQILIHTHTHTIKNIKGSQKAWVDPSVHRQISWICLEETRRQCWQARSYNVRTYTCVYTPSLPNANFPWVRIFFHVCDFNHGAKTAQKNTLHCCLSMGMWNEASYTLAMNLIAFLWQCFWGWKCLWCHKSVRHVY